MTLLLADDKSTVTIRCGRVAPEGWNRYLTKWGYDGFHLRSEWATVLQSALHHQPSFLWAEHDGVIVGVLPLVLVSGPFFGRFLSSLPYLNTGGVLADSPALERRLIDHAVTLADSLEVRQLMLRHERHVAHPAMNRTITEKVHMRLELAPTSEEFWSRLKSKRRSQIRKPLADPSIQVRFGHHDLVDDFYSIYCHNMRDLGTPPYAKSLFQTMLDQFGGAAEICTVAFNQKHIASGFLVHGPDVTMIPSASSLKEFSHLSCNLLMYWHAMNRAIERGQKVFDFGRSSVGSGTYSFKKQWGCEEFPAVWQYYVRKGDIEDARPNNGKFDRMIRVWQRLPVWLTRIVGPPIVQGVP